MITINMHNITSAEAIAIKGASWVTIKSGNGSEITLFLSADKCKAIADIINGTEQMFAYIEK